MLAFNNLSVPFFTDAVERVLVLKNDNLWRNFRWRAENFESFHPVYLADTLSRLLHKKIVPKHLLRNELFAGDGKVMIGMEWDELVASDHHPLCFEKVVIPGLFKVSAEQIKTSCIEVGLKQFLTDTVAAGISLSRAPSHSGHRAEESSRLVPFRRPKTSHT